MKTMANLAEIFIFLYQLNLKKRELFDLENYIDIPISDWCSLEFHEQDITF